MQLLKELRKRSGLNQKQVASKIGYKNQQYIYNVEKGLSFPTQKMAQGMAEIYGVEYEFIVSEIIKEKLNIYRAKLEKQYTLK